eukprot:TRINITY_DN1580_c0_g2_i1.p2 TRINITY_DN1580_c0_g2~~TRINITY_DN1580_c0_g2_i1.p2  ORF type:complete len:261 (-),score=112.34 TRINITY_DN1580_c0_g2_i1:2-784(-)
MYQDRIFFFFQAEDGIRDRSPSRGLGDVYKRQKQYTAMRDAPSFGLLVMALMVFTSSMIAANTQGGIVRQKLERVLLERFLQGPVSENFGTDPNFNASQERKKKSADDKLAQEIFDEMVRKEREADELRAQQWMIEADEAGADGAEQTAKKGGKKKKGGKRSGSGGEKKKGKGGKKGAVTLPDGTVVPPPPKKGGKKKKGVKGNETPPTLPGVPGVPTPPPPPKLSLIHISEPTRLGMISYAVFCLKKKKYSILIHRRNP